MNEFAAYTVPVPGGHWGMLRFARDGQPKPIMGKGEKPQIFPSEVEALRAVNRHLLAYFNGDYQRYGEKMQARSEAEAHFPGLKPIYRKGRKIEVERKGAVA